MFSAKRNPIVNTQEWQIVGMMYEMRRILRKGAAKRRKAHKVERQNRKAGRNARH